MVEWTGNQQILFLLQSVCVGFPVGLLLDLISVSNKTRSRVWQDALFGIAAALFVFFGALAIMDGQLHPLLFLGSFFGILLMHYTVGRLFVRVVIWLRKGCCRIRMKMKMLLTKHLNCWLNLTQKHGALSQSAEKGIKKNKNTSYF